MRELRVVGVETDGSHVICQDPQSGEKFRIASDERLRAAARGDITRLGQIEIEMESALRPREIQARIRAGASVAEVAAAAGVGVDKIERFAHPVLLERSRATELAGAAHPIRHDGPAVATLAESVAEGLVAYGHNPADADWDAWKDDSGYWVVQVAWSVGRTDNLAHWRYQPGTHGGTVDPLDDLADELTHPETIAPRRRLTPVAAPEVAVETTSAGREEVTIDANSLIGAQRARQERRTADDDHGTVPLDFGFDDDETDERTPPAPVTPISAPVAQAPVEAAPVEAHVEDEPAEPALRETTDAEPAATPDSTPNSSESSATRDSGPAHADRPRKKKTRKPAVPAWEDVLLGVRSNGNS
ncbi:septation protein SepH [Gordonia metallireducens]|uniref:septation protein SepH n=1 Tax=Gordonia metallireducens TaxID=2897779 RepID=UPI001E36119F|nr:septation protein SepH [Gordonia metallireducens]